MTYDGAPDCTWCGREYDPSGWDNRLDMCESCSQNWHVERVKPRYGSGGSGTKHPGTAWSKPRRPLSVEMFSAALKRIWGGTLERLWYSSPLLDALSGKVDTWTPGTGLQMREHTKPRGNRRSRPRLCLS